MKREMIYKHEVVFLLLFSWMLSFPKGCVHSFAGPAYIHGTCLQLCMQTKAHDLHAVIPQLELLLPSPSLARSPKMDYFATNYLQM